MNDLVFAIIFYVEHDNKLDRFIEQIIVDETNYTKNDKNINFLKQNSILIIIGIHSLIIQ